MELYDHIYDVENYFGEPYPELIHFFDKYQHKGYVLDLGCGQGRDAIALAQLGYKVTGIDISSLGIEQMLKKAKSLNIKLNGIVTDMFSFKIPNEVDIVMLNSMLHFLKDDLNKEVELLKRIGNELKIYGLICICLWKSEQNEKLIKDIFAQLKSEYKVLNNTYLDYTFRDKKSEYKVDMQYNFFVAQKIK